MPTQEIPRQNWPSFTEAFARQHENWLVTLDVTPIDKPGGMPGEGRILAEQQPLRGVALERSSRDESFWIAVGEPSHKVVHQITDPATVVFQTEEDGSHEGLRIDSKGGEAFRLHFRVAARPEEVDGIQ